MWNCLNIKKSQKNYNENIIKFDKGNLNKAKKDKDKAKNEKLQTPKIIEDDFHEMEEWEGK